MAKARPLGSAKVRVPDADRACGRSTRTPPGRLCRPPLQRLNVRMVHATDCLVERGLTCTVTRILHVCAGRQAPTRSLVTLRMGPAEAGARCGAGFTGRCDACEPAAVAGCR